MNTLPEILYVEDNINDIELTMAAFGESGFANQIIIAQDGQEALDYLFYKGKFSGREMQSPAFVLLDLKMPKVDGLEVLQTIRNSKEYKDLPVVMLTSSQMESDVIKGYQLGANGFVVKPIDFVEFVKAIKTIGYYWAVLNTSPSSL
jgi:CheY-like chemotaxis protein